MPSTLLRIAALAAALPVLLGAATAGTALARPTTAARVDPAAPRAGAPSATAALTLINGDRLLTGSDGKGRRSSVVLKAPGSGLSTSLVTLRSGSRELVIPWAALPYLGRGIDPRLFEVGALQRAERDGRLPITVRYTGHRPALPGVTVTSRVPGLEQGYLTASSARAFAAALARQMMSDHSRGSYGTDRLFAGGVNISLTGPAPARARPNFRTHTLTVKATNLAGKPDTGDVVQVFNVDNKAVFGVGGEDWFNNFYRGTRSTALRRGPTGRWRSSSRIPDGRRMYGWTCFRSSLSPGTPRFTYAPAPLPARSPWRRSAATTTCAPPSAATTHPPAWEPPTAPPASSTPAGTWPLETSARGQVPVCLRLARQFLLSVILAACLAITRRAAGDRAARL